MNKKTLLILIITSIQIPIIIFLSAKLIKNQNILGTKNSINYQKIQRQPGDPLSYFEEFTPDHTIISQDEWLDDVSYTINSDSLNERFDYSIEKPEKTFRIITIGDSFTMGRSVNTKDNYPETLEDLLNQNCTSEDIEKFEVINLGVGGYDLEFSIKRFEERGEKYDPDLVIWLILQNDFVEIAELIIPIWNKDRDHQFFKSGNFDNYEKLQEKQKGQLQKQYKSEEIINYNKEAIKLINQQYSNELLIINFPFLNKTYKNMVKNFSEKRQKTIHFEINTNLYAKPNRYYPDGHPSKIGYQLIAKDIFNYLNSTNTIPCK